MHRVELKDGTFYDMSFTWAGVPNAPCGVESRYWEYQKLPDGRVPNAPCGVERQSGEDSLKLWV